MSKYEWKSLGANKDGHVSGFYYDALKVSGKRIMTIGLTWHCGSIKFSLPKTSTFPRLWNFPAIGGPNTGIFVSIASLRDINHIEVCKVGARCTGMLIHHKDESVDVLGQWYTAQGSSEHEVIYNHEQGNIHTICFAVSELAVKSFVTRIWVLTKMSKAPKGLPYTHSFGRPDFKKVVRAHTQTARQSANFLPRDIASGMVVFSAFRSCCILGGAIATYANVVNDGTPTYLLPYLPHFPHLVRFVGVCFRLCSVTEAWTGLLARMVQTCSQAWYRWLGVMDDRLRGFGRQEGGRV